MYIKELELENFKDEYGVVHYNELRKMYPGKFTLIDSYFYRKENKYDLLIIDTVCNQDMQSAIDYMKELGIKQFIFADNSSSALSEILTLIDNKCKMERVTYMTAVDFVGNSYDKEGILVTL